MEKIVTKYPNINLTWLLTGVGGMFTNTVVSLDEAEYQLQLMRKLDEPGQLKNIDIKAMNADATNYAQIRTAKYARDGRYEWPYKVRTKMAEEKPDLETFITDLNTIFETKAVIVQLADSRIGEAHYWAIENLGKVHSMKELKERIYNAYAPLEAHSKAFARFATCCHAFLKTWKVLRRILDWTTILKNSNY